MYNNFSKPLTLRPKATLPLGHLDLDFLSRLRRNWPPLADACPNALASCGVFCGGWRRTWHWRETRSSRTLLGHRWGSERCTGEREPASEMDTERVSWKPQQNTTGEIRKLSHPDRPQNPHSPPRRTPLRYLPASYAGSQALHWSQYPPVKGRIQRLHELNEEQHVLGFLV